MPVPLNHQPHLFTLRILHHIAVVLLLGIWLPATTNAQKTLQFNKTTVNFGTIRAWDNPPAVFEFTNTSTSTQFILAPRAGRKIFVDFPKDGIAPGDTGSIRVTYYTDMEGEFSEEISFYASGATAPTSLTIKGNIKSLATNALTECPDFSDKKGNEVTETQLEGLVIDKVTREPIEGAAVAISYDGGWVSDKKGEFSMKLLMGLYSFYVWKPGYKELVQPVGIKRFNDVIVFELEKADEPVVERDTVPQPADTLVVIPTDPEIPDENPDFSTRIYKANNIVLLVDVSGSMKREGKMDSLKSAMSQLAGLMRSIDHISLIAFSSYTREVFLNYTGENKTTMLAKIDSLLAKGTTNGVLGIENAYQLALNQFIADGNNLVIVATDGIFADASGGDNGFKNIASKYLDKGIKLSVIGFGADRDANERMQKIADAGGGNYIPFLSGESAAEKLTDEIRNQSRK